MCIYDMLVLTSVVRTDILEFGAKKVKLQKLTPLTVQLKMQLEN